jgi:hypothetical protein
MVWDGFLDRPLLGLGPENLTVAIYRHFDPSYYAPPEAFAGFPDRAHNVLFDCLGAIGVIGTLAFLSIFVVFYRHAARRAVPAAPQSPADGPVARALMLAMPVAYLVQNLAFFDTVMTSICLYAFLAFAQNLRWTAEPLPETPPAGAAGDGTRQVAPSRERPLRIGLAVVGIPLLLSLVVMSAVLPYQKASLLNEAIESPYRNRSLPEVAADIDQAVGFYSPAGNEETTVFLLEGLCAMMDADPNLPVQVVRDLLGHIEPQAAPGVRQWLALGKVYTAFASRESRVDDYEHAIAYFSKAREHAPGLPGPLYALFSLYRHRGDRQGMAELGHEILSLWPEDSGVRRLVSPGPPSSALH